MEIQVGLTVVTALVVLLWGVTWLKDLSLQRQVRVWHVRFPQTGGLGASDEVQVNGIRKGAVSSIDLVGDHVVVNLALAKEIQLTTDCTVAIRNVGLMGEKVIAVDLSTSGPVYGDRDTIVGVFEKGIPEVMAEMGTTVDAVNSLAVQLKTIAENMQKSGNLDETLKNFRKTSEDLQLSVSENRAAVKATMDNFASASKTAKALTTDREAQLRQTIDSFQRSADNLERLTVRMDSLRASLQSVTNKIDHGDGSLAKLINDRKLYDEVNTSVTSLRTLVEDMKKNPKKYINLRIF